MAAVSHVPKRASISFRAVMVSAMTGCLVTACLFGGPVTDPAARWNLELVNEAGARIRVALALGQHHSFLSPTGKRGGIVVLDPGEKRAFVIAAGLGQDTSEDNIGLTYFHELHFFDAASDTPYQSYVYLAHKYVRDAHGGDDVWLYERSDGAMERLFVRSPERPFYLERDKEDGDLGRLVITFVPSADATAGGAGK